MSFVDIDMSMTFFRIKKNSSDEYNSMTFA